jgi:hypothetical protein
MVFKPSFKCFKNEQINLSQAFLKLETLGSMSITQLYIGSTHINDKKIIDRLSTHYQPFYGFSLVKVFFSNYVFNTHY